MNEILRAALEVYLPRDIGWLLPLRGKVPVDPFTGIYLKDWPRLATKDPATLRRWFGVGPTLNLGLAPRGRAVLIDVDRRHGDDDRLHDLERELGPLPLTPSYTTGDGFRLLFGPPGVPLRGEIDGIEVKYEKGQVVVPPSIHPKNGRPYAWDIGLDEVPLARLTSSWLERLRTPTVETPEMVGQSRDDPLVEIAAVTYIEAICGRTPDYRGYVRCPFHQGGQERSPSLRPDGPLWVCFGRDCKGPDSTGKLGGTIYTFAAVAWGYPLPLRGPAFLRVQERLYDLMTAFLERRRAA